MKNHHYNTEPNGDVLSFRNSPTTAHLTIWNEVLQEGNCMGYRFIRKRPIDQFIVDFFSKELNLIIQIKNSSGCGNVNLQREKNKDKRLTELGYNVIWFEVHDALQNRGKIASILEAYIIDFENLKRLIILQ